MDILDIFGHFYLNHLSPLWGYFSYIGQLIFEQNVDLLSILFQFFFKEGLIFMHTNKVKIVAFSFADEKSLH